MAYQGVTLKGTIPDNDLTFILASDIKEEHVGLAVAQDTTAANTVKLAGDGDVIVGRLESYEDRTAIEGVVVGAVKLVGGLELKKSEAAMAVGDSVVGAGAGLVKAGTDANGIVVWEVRTDSVIVIKNS